jgi:hypothetical protein
MKAFLGREPRGREVRLCVACNLMNVDEFCDSCGGRTEPFYSSRVQRFARVGAVIKSLPPVPAHVINREYSYPSARLLEGGRTESNRRRH